MSDLGSLFSYPTLTMPVSRFHRLLKRVLNMGVLDPLGGNFEHDEILLIFPQAFLVHDVINNKVLLAFRTKAKRMEFVLKFGPFEEADAVEFGP